MKNAFHPRIIQPIKFFVFPIILIKKRGKIGQIPTNELLLNQRELYHKVSR